MGHVHRREVVTGGLALATTPFGLRAQQPKRIERIALVTTGTSAAEMVAGGFPSWSAFLLEMRRLGYVEGQNLVIDRHSGQGRADPYASLAREVVESRPDVIVAGGTPLVAALKALTTTIPLVVAVPDPVVTGLVASLGRPGGNITGFTPDAGPEFNAKILQLLHETVPGAVRMAYLDVRMMWELPAALAVRDAAVRLGLLLIPILLDPPVTERSYRDAFAAMERERVEAIYLGFTSENIAHVPLVANLAAASRLPAVFLENRFAQAGGLMSYGPDASAIFRSMAGYVVRILRGEKPADLPVQLPRDFEFIINLKTARALDLKIPEHLLIFATEVIE
jgi:putative tryptophan/tyrosine transport system substrate-binding protein